MSKFITFGVVVVLGLSVVVAQHALWAGGNNGLGKLDLGTAPILPNEITRVAGTLPDSPYKFLP